MGMPPFSLRAGQMGVVIDPDRSGCVLDLTVGGVPALVRAGHDPDVDDGAIAVRGAFGGRPLGRLRVVERSPVSCRLVGRDQEAGVSFLARSEVTAGTLRYELTAVGSASVGELSLAACVAGWDPVSGAVIERSVEGEGVRFSAAGGLGVVVAFDEGVAVDVARDDRGAWVLTARSAAGGRSESVGLTIRVDAAGER